MILSKIGIFGTIGRISHAIVEKSTMDDHMSSDTIEYGVFFDFILLFSLVWR